MSQDTSRVQCGSCGGDLTTEQFPTQDSIVKCVSCGTSGRYEDVISEATNQVLESITKEFKDIKINMKF